MKLPCSRSIAVLMMLALVPMTGYAAGRKKPPAAPPRISVEKLDLPAVESFLTDSGMKVFYIRDDLPRLIIRVSVGFGKLYENAGNAGISELIAKTLTLGGSKKYPGETLNSAIENIGGQLNIEASWEETAITVQVLSRYADQAFDIMEDLLKNPNFEERYIIDAKSLLVETIRRKKDSPEALAFDKVRELIFNGSGYGATPREETVNAVTRAGLQNTWSRYFTAANMMCGVASSLDLPAVRRLADEKLSGLERGNAQAYTVETGKIYEALRLSTKKIYLIPRPLPQATIVVGTIAPGIRDPRSVSLGVMNYILGEGSFSSRLMQEIRVKRGLSYAVQSVIKFRRDTGVFIAFAQTRSDQASLTLSLLLENISKMAAREVNAEELHWAKQSIINSYIFEFDTAVKVIAQSLSLHYNNLDPSYLTGYPGKVSMVTSDEILRNSRELFKTGYVKVVIGDASLKKELSKFGEVVEIQP